MRNAKEHRFARYIALGDSISIDLYPSLDLGDRSPAEPAEEVGATSRLYRNRDDLWPEFTGCDLSTRWPGIEYLDQTADGAATLRRLTKHFQDSTIMEPSARGASGAAPLAACTESRAVSGTTTPRPTAGPRTLPP